MKQFSSEYLVYFYNCIPHDVALVCINVGDSCYSDHLNAISRYKSKEKTHVLTLTLLVTTVHVHVLEKNKINKQIDFFQMLNSKQLHNVGAKWLTLWCIV